MISSFARGGIDLSKLAGSGSTLVQRSAGMLGRGPDEEDSGSETSFDDQLGRDLCRRCAMPPATCVCRALPEAPVRL